MSSRRIQRQRQQLEQRYAVVNDTTALAMWMKAEAAAERAEQWRARMYMAGMVAIYLCSTTFVVAVGLLLVDIVRGWR